MDTTDSIDIARVDEILSRFNRLSIAVVGDFFLDKYMIVDPALSEVSIETGLEARQIVEIRCSPGAAGTVMNNLSALGVGELHAVGMTGDDGQGYELRRGLEFVGASTSHLISVADRFTPTYTKPMVRTAGRETEIERLDIKNRLPLAREVEDRIIGAALELAGAGADAILIADQVQERNCGVVTDRVREALQNLSRNGTAQPGSWGSDGTDGTDETDGTYAAYGGLGAGRRRCGALVLADSRVRIGEFRDVVVKPNRAEAGAAMASSADRELTMEETAAAGRALAERNGRPVFITLASDGIMACTASGATHVPALPLRGPIDIVGAGDSVFAGIACSLAAGASPAEAALIGNLCASVTIHKLGTTGTASLAEIVRVLKGPG